MTNSMRWRIMTLQAILVLVLGFASGFLYSESRFVNGYIHDQLVAQKIYFPPASEIKAGGALDPAEFPASIRQYAGQEVDNGDKAYQYGTNFIGIHLSKVANGQTYSQVSTAAQKDPTNTKLAGQKTTLFQGETLKNSLLQAWGWSQVAYYTYLASIAMAVAALITLATFVFELVAWRRQSAVKVARTKVAPVPA